MPTKDPITVVGLLATVMLLTGAAMLYLTPELTPPPKLAVTSPFKEPAGTATPPPKAAAEPAPPATPAPAIPALPSLSEAELKALTPTEREHYEKMRQSLQQVLQQVQVLEQENTRLQQTIEQGDAKNKQLDAEIDKLRAAENQAVPAKTSTQ